MTSKTFYQTHEVEFTVDLDEFHDDDIIEAVYERNLQDEFREDYLTPILEKLYQLRRTGQDVMPLLDKLLSDSLGRII